MPIFLVLAMAAALAFPAPGRDSITLQIGGLKSGPSKTYVDLARGVVLAGRPPKGTAPGVASGIFARNLPVTRQGTLNKDQAARLRTLADAVLAHGAEAPQRCDMSIDRTIELDVARGDRAVSGSVYCPSKDAEALIGAVLKAAGAD